jgi:serine/threonine-protein kinase
VHRDLKPSNLMWTADGQLKVLDFGLAHLSAGADVESLTRTGCVLGTIPYMAPEQLLGEPADPRSDVYSFGAVLYELATGRRPFSGRHIGEILEAIFERAPVALLSTRSDVPAALASLIDRCLARDPAQRPCDGSELASELEKATA